MRMLKDVQEYYFAMYKNVMQMLRKRNVAEV